MELGSYHLKTCLLLQESNNGQLLSNNPREFESRRRSWQHVFDVIRLQVYSYTSKEGVPKRQYSEIPVSWAKVWTVSQPRPPSWGPITVQRLLRTCCIISLFKMTNIKHLCLLQYNLSLLQWYWHEVNISQV